MSVTLKTLSKTSALFLICLLGLPSAGSGQTGSALDPFTALDQAWNVASSDIYYFLINGTSFSTYVESGSGWILVAAGEGGSEESSYATTTSLTLQSDQILPASIYTSTLVTAVRITASSGTGLPFDIMTDDAGVLTNLQNDVTLSVGTASATWTGTGTARVEGGCGSENSSLDRTIYHCGCNGDGLHWLVSETTGLEKLSYNESSQNDLELWIRTDAPPLPVKLSYFEAIPVENKGVRLRWQTTSETNSDFFAVERSSDIHFWEQIGTTDAAGTSSGAIDYLFFDHNPASGISYYRLKQTDMAGSYTYSEIREISGPLKARVLAYPNPATSALSVEGDPAELQELRIYNLMGQDMSHRITSTTISASSLNLDLTRLPAGVYLVTTPNSVQRVRKE